jgi:predicted small secreted protein
MRIEPSLLTIVSDIQDGKETVSHFCRLLHHSPLFYILPPCTQEIDYDFSGRLIYYEHLFLQAQTLAAWYATLGGGYFLCHRLSTAIQLARRQRRVAEWMGDEGMADRCTLNEVYNYLHAGHFRIAFSMLKALQASAQVRQDAVLWAMCNTARLFGRRMRRAGKRLTSQASSVDDDYQRIRIVERL